MDDEAEVLKQAWCKFLYHHFEYDEEKPPPEIGARTPWYCKRCGVSFADWLETTSYVAGMPIELLPLYYWTQRSSRKVCCNRRP